MVHKFYKVPSDCFVLGNTPFEPEHYCFSIKGFVVPFEVVMRCAAYSLESVHQRICTWNTTNIALIRLFASTRSSAFCCTGPWWCTSVYTKDAGTFSETKSNIWQHATTSFHIQGIDYLTTSKILYMPILNFRQVTPILHYGVHEILIRTTSRLNWKSENASTAIHYIHNTISPTSVTSVINWRPSWSGNLSPRDRVTKNCIEDIKSLYKEVCPC